MRVYVAAPLSKREMVLELHACLERMGLQTAATWPLFKAEEMTLPQARALCNTIDADLDDAEAALVLANDLNGEVFAQFGQAIARGIPVVWLDGPPILSTSRVGVVDAATMADALAVLKGWAAVVDGHGRGHHSARLYVEWSRRAIMGVLDQAATEAEGKAAE